MTMNIDDKIQLIVNGIAEKLKSNFDINEVKNELIKFIKDISKNGVSLDELREHLNTCRDNNCVIGSTMNKLLEQATKEGYAQGYDVGTKEGYKKGKNDGAKMGFIVGRKSR